MTTRHISLKRMGKCFLYYRHFMCTQNFFCKKWTDQNVWEKGWSVGIFIYFLLNPKKTCGQKKVRKFCPQKFFSLKSPQKYQICMEKLFHKILSNNLITF